jgi:outer membrane receptor protein involved in Fe transport
MRLSLAGCAYAFAIFAALSCAPFPALAANSSDGTGIIAGTVTDTGGKPIAGANVTLTGPTTRSTVTDAAGAFTLSGVVPGIYSASVRKAGFVSVTSDVAVLQQQRVAFTVTLQSSSFSSLRTIGNAVAYASRGMNTSTASIDTISSADVIGQGQTQASRVLDQIPGIIGNAVSFSGNSGWNTADSWVAIEPQIRGALPYETATLIDGHPVQVGASGSYNVSFLSAYLLQNVEVVKGPGAMPSDIDYAVGGTVNFRTLEPSRERRASFDYGVDNYGGQISNFRATGTTSNGKLGYVLDYALDGSPGPFNNTPAWMPYQQGNGPTQAVNGHLTCVDPTLTNCPYTFQAGPAQYQSSYQVVAPLIGFGAPMNSDHFLRAELAKVRANFSQESSLTISYLGGQAAVNNLGSFAFSDNTTFFAPPPGYTGSVPAGPINACCENVTSTGYDYNNQGIFQAEFHTTLGTNTFLARYYTASLYDFNTRGDNGPPATQTFNQQLYGGAQIGNPATTEIFNGQTAAVTFYDQYIGTLTHDRLGGYTVQFDHPAGENVYSLSYDQTASTSSEQYTFPLNPQPAPPAPLFTTQDLVPGGSGQQFKTIAARAYLTLSPKVNATLGDYQVAYTSRYSPNGDGNSTSTTHAYNAPRAALTYRATRDVSWRFAAGASIAPPYITLLTTPSGPPAGNLGGFNNTYYTQTLNSGDIRPETAWGYDLGVDRRFKNGLVASADVYETTLRDQFLQTVFLAGTYLGVPLYDQQTENLGHSRYEGIEVALRNAPATGFGFLAQGALLRAYAYDLPAGFYDSAAGPNTVNLGILPNVNFMPSGLGYNGLSASRVPYSQGYGELNYRSRHGAFYRLGMTYFGPNNGYNEPAFEVVSASMQLPLGARTSLLLAGDNLTGAYDKPYVGIYSGIPVPLANGLLGQTVSGQYGPATFKFVVHEDL